MGLASVAVLLLALSLGPLTHAFCQPGCSCFDEGRDVRCDHANLTAFPYMLNPMLRKLSLIDAKLRVLDAASISVYQELEFLDLSRNGIEELPSGFLVNFPKLREVRLAHNRLRLLTDDLFKDLPMLEVLDFSDNQIERIMPDAFVELPTLNALNLSGNELHLLSGKSFNGLASLSGLDLSHNRFEKLQRDVFNELKNLAFLSLNNNKLRSLPRLAFMEQKKLVKLDASHNAIERVEEGAFSGLHSLKALDLSHNNLRDLSSRNWPYLSELELLDLSHNRFSTLSAGFFEGLGALRSLSLSHNSELRRVELNAFAGLYKLDSVQLRNCAKLGFVDEAAFEHPNHLTSLDLSHNALESLSASLVNWRQLDVLDLSGNAWRCDCELLKFLPEVLLELRRKGDTKTPRSDVRPICAAPEELKGVAVETTSSSVCASFAEPLFWTLLVASGLLLLATLLIAVGCVRARGRSQKEKNLSRAPLYTGGSSFTDSLTYDKSDPLLYRQLQTLPLVKTQPVQARLSPYGDNSGGGGDYYSSIVMLPPSAHTHAHASSTLPLYYGDDASPYAMGAVPDYHHHHMPQRHTLRPPSFIAPPPPPPSMPPPPLSSTNYNPDPHAPVPSTEL